MRLHHLAVTAFGPFAGREEVDFDALGAAGLFLFTGATGAGKTSILDAICFALYGQVPGARHGAALRSEHAAPDVSPGVTLELTISGRRLLVTRSPAWERPKRRGSGTTTQPAKIRVDESVCGTWETVSTRLDEASQLLRRLVGLSMAQFCQVVLLPQGEFAEFLRTDPDRRRDLLESLFDTGRFACVESWLVDERRSAQRALDAQDEVLARVLARAAEVAERHAVPVDLRPDTAAQWMTTLRDEASARAVATADAEEAARQRRLSAQHALGAAESLAAAQARFAVLSHRRQELLAEAPAVSALVIELESARRAATVVPLWNAAHRLEQSLADAVGHVAVASSALRGRGDTIDALALHDPVHLRARASAVRAETGALHRMIDDEARADQLAHELNDLERAVVALDSQADEVGVWLDAVPDTAERLQRARDRAGQCADRLPGLQAARDRAAERLRAGRRRNDLEEQLGTRRDELRAAVDRAQRARKKALDLREARLLGMAAELAGELTAGVPCAVCGSECHPHPAQSRAGAVSRDDEAAAAVTAQVEDDRRTEIHAVVGRTEVALAEARALADDTDVDTLQLLLMRTQEEWREAASVAAAFDAADVELRAFRQEQERRLQQRMSIDAEAQRLRERVVLVDAQVESLRRELALARGADVTVRARVERLAALADACDTLTDALVTADRIRHDLNEARARAASAAACSGFEDLASVTRCVRDERRLVDLEEQRATHVAELAAVDELLADQGLRAAAAAAPADVHEAKRLLDDADAEHQRCVGERHAASRCATALARLARELDRLLDARGPAAARRATVDRLSRLAEGKSADNRLRMSLSAYVLAARLEEVARAASQRLLSMSSGRYSLLHSDVAGPGRGARGGLHLRVVDAWTGGDRDPSTLSGGETFAASLALALGLTDVVTAEAGGSLLETLFVDEGFGSLDEETLDEVMGMLDGLRNGGRVVGIVSHVADLRQRIPTQLQIVKGRNGSTVRQ